MLPYLLLFILMCICATTDIYPLRNRWIITSITFIVALGMIILRDELGGSDYFMYKLFYSKVVPLADYLNGQYEPFYRTKIFEVGFVTLCSAIKSFDFTKGPYLMIFVISTFTLSTLWLSLKRYTPYIFIALLFYLYKAYFWHEFTLLRQSISIALFVFSIRYIKEKKYVKYIFINLIGVSMHASAIILIPLIFILNKKWKDTDIFILICIAFFLNMAGSYLFTFAMKIAGIVGLESRFGFYLYNERAINPLNFIEIMIILFISLFYRKQYEKEEPYFNIFLNMFVFSSFLIIAFSSFEIFARFKEYFVISYMILISYIIGDIKNNRTKIAAFSLFCAYVLLGYVRYLLTFDAGGLIPYKWIL
ncbi:MAG: EpsG family protein [Prevotellaceae bacterium]|nr:EpsG family protein [Prevotellaceae bacterium]